MKKFDECKDGLQMSFIQEWDGKFVIHCICGLDFLSLWKLRIKLQHDIICNSIEQPISSTHIPQTDIFVQISINNYIIVKTKKKNSLNCKSVLAFDICVLPSLPWYWFGFSKNQQRGNIVYTCNNYKNCSSKTPQII